MSDIEFELNFTDQTMCQLDGVFSEVLEIMSSEFPSKTDWMLSSEMSIDGIYGLSIFVLHFFHDGKIIIIDYQPSIGDLFYNPDIQVISVWAQENGWKVPEPHIDLVKSNIEFWKHFLNTLLVDSDYLDDIFGKRDHLLKQDEETMKEEDNQLDNLN